MTKEEGIQVTEMDTNNENNNNVNEEHDNGNDNDNDNDNDNEDQNVDEKPSGKNKKNEDKKRRKKKKKKTNRHSNNVTTTSEQNETADENDDVEIEYITTNDIDLSNPEYAQFKDVFARFQFTTAPPESVPEENKEEAKPTKGEDEGSDSDSDNEKKGNNANEEGKLSRKKLRRLKRLGIADLKQKVKKPEVVEWVDVTASDPVLLVQLKSYRNTIPVPRHWSQKRKYLQGKRGMEKPPFELPEFIRDTGISELREAVREKEENMKLKTKMRERVQPKMGKLEIDYQKLHDAFFKFQKKPLMTLYGDLYYEGKENEVKVKEKKPGVLSEDLKTALSIPPGAPPPWLINMQRYGPPPSYPNLKIPGLNAPIPEFAQWGYHPGGWGKPPVDELGNPLYGDVFGTTLPPPPPEIVQAIEREEWGLIQDIHDSESSEEEEEEEEEQKEEEEDMSGLTTPGISSVASGLETPDIIDLRKDIKRGGEETPDVNVPVKQLYTVIPQKDTKGVNANLMGSAHTYDLSILNQKGKKGEGVEVALDPTDMDSLDDQKIKQLFEQQKAEENEGEDLSDMVAEHAAQQSKKRKGKSDSKSSNKKSRDFKF